MFRLVGLVTVESEDKPILTVRPMMKDDIVLIGDFERFSNLRSSRLGLHFKVKNITTSREKELLYLKTVETIIVARTTLFFTTKRHF